MPVFDTFYLSDFQGRISLADASISIAASGPFGSIVLRAFISHDDGVICCEIEKDLIESSPTEIVMERYGSRTFAYWYALVNRDATIGTGGTDAGVDDGGIYITHQLTSGKFAAVCQLVETDGLELSTSRLKLALIQDHHRRGGSWKAFVYGGSQLPLFRRSRTADEGQAVRLL